jgi:aryl-alcohol dehydrogenase-like predicted oxidoreductase
MIIDPCNLSRLALGTVQWGLPYGIGNSSGRPSDQELRRMLTYARSEGISLLDTAQMYGDAESRIGVLDIEGMSIVTKMPCLVDAVTQDLGNFLGATFAESLHHLNVDSVYGYLAHRSADIVGHKGEETRAFLNDLRALGKVKKVGVSIYEAEELQEVLRVFHPDIVQLPLNVLDQRLLRDGTLAELKTAGVEVHVRSVFLQGLLLLDIESIPSYFAPIRPLLSRWHELAAAQGRSLPEACISFVRSLLEVDKIIIGVESLPQLIEIITAFTTPGTVDVTGLFCQDPHWVDPRRWQVT